MEERTSLLGAFALARNIAIVLGAAVAVSILTRERGHSWELIALIVVVGLALFALLEAVPRALVARNPERWGLWLAPFMGPFKLLFGGAGRLLSIPARAVARPPAGEEEEEMLRLLEIEDDEGALEDEERKMIRGVFGLEDTAVREIMTPRTDIAAVDTESTVDDVVQLIIERGFSRIPLYEKNADAIVGIVYAKDLFRDMAKGRELKELREIARPAFFVPESKRLDALLTDMRKQRVHMAIVVDEYGGTAGLVTLEDIIEELLGEIVDEFDVEDPLLEPLPNGDWRANARVPVDELNEMLGLDLPEGDWDTLGGLVFSLVGRMPTEGETVQVGNLVLRAERLADRRIGRVRITQLPEPIATDDQP
jgi:CBS domain containing-hemolysin-like protein